MTDCHIFANSRSSRHCVWELWTRPRNAPAPTYLTHLKAFPALKFLFLYDANLSGEVLAPLGQFDRLETLGLGSTSIHNDDLASIAGLTHLRCLGLNGTKVTGVGLAHLTGLKGLEDLEGR